MEYNRFAPLPIRLMMNMACVLFRLTPAEALNGVTRQDALGRILESFQADLCLWDIEHPAELSYQLGPCPLRQRIIAGNVVYDAT